MERNIDDEYIELINKICFEKKEPTQEEIDEINNKILEFLFEQKLATFDANKHCIKDLTLTLSHDKKPLINISLYLK